MGKHSRQIGITAIIAITIISLLASGERIVIYIAKQQIKKALDADSVTIKKCVINPLKMISLSDIEIKKTNFLHAKIKRASAKYSIPAVFGGSLSGMEIDGVRLSIGLKDNFPLGLKTTVAPKKQGFFTVRNLKISETRITLSNRDFSLKGTLSAELSPHDGKINEINAVLESYKSGNLTIDTARLVGPLSHAGAALSINKIAAGDAVIKNVEGTVRINGNRLTVEPVHSRISKGSISGKAEISLDETLEYSILLTCSGLDLETFIGELKLNEKIGLTGLIYGDIAVKGAGLGIIDISGSFSTNAPGGTLTIKDDSMLKNIAKASKMPMEIIMENLRNYEYTLGIMKVSLDENDLALEVAMDGDAGKRKFNVILHDIITIKKGVL